MPGWVLGSWQSQVSLYGQPSLGTPCGAPASCHLFLALGIMLVALGTLVALCIPVALCTSVFLCILVPLCILVALFILATLHISVVLGTS